MKGSLTFLALLTTSALLTLFRSLITKSPADNLNFSRTTSQNFLAQKRNSTNTSITHPNHQITNHTEISQFEPGLNYYYSVLKKVHSYGKWKAEAGTGMSRFTQEEGLAVMRYMQENSLGVQLTLFDGLYADKNSLNLLFDFKANRPTISSKDGTASFQRLWLAKHYSEYTHLEGNSDYCLSNATIYFVNLKTDKPLQINQTVDEESIGVRIVVHNPFCPFKFSTSLMANNDGVSEIHRKSYIGLTATFGVLECVMTFLLCNMFRTKPNSAVYVSTYSFMVLTAMDFYMLIFNATNLTGSLETYIVISLGYMFLCLTMQKVIWTIGNIQMQKMNRRYSARTIWSMHIWPCTFLIVPAIISFLFDSNLIFYFTFLFAVPQIMQNFKNSRKYRARIWPVIGLMTPKLLFLAYLKLDLNNIFKYCPNSSVFWNCIFLLSAQAAILWVQTRWPRFGLEKKPSYIFYNLDNNAIQDVCSICLEYCQTEINTAAKTIEPLLKENKLIQKMVRTLCNHEFHEDCLRRWIKSKLECPYCRQVLSAIPEPEDDH